MKRCTALIFVFIFLAFALIAASTAAFLFWQKIERFEPLVYYYVPPERSFIYSLEEGKDHEKGIEKYLQKRVDSERNNLIREKISFIDLDLREMELTLFKKGEVFEVFPIQSKGKEGSWWETPPGVYFAGDKVANHFSSVAQAWMPYGVQFYGNFFIHGWPFYPDGRLLAPGPSGGCVRMKTKDAAVIFDFAERGMPILVFDQKSAPPMPALQMDDSKITPLQIKGQSALVADLDTGEILLNKEMDSEIYAGPVLHGMIALTASEVINLERRITAKSWMIEKIKEKEGIIVPGKSYRAYDLINYLIGYSSKEAGLVLSYFFTPEYFTVLMNVKAKAIGMNKTNFASMSGHGRENTTTLYDLAKMIRYIKDFRGFILKMGEPKKERENLSGILKGPGTNGEETLITLWKMEESRGDSPRNIFIGLADSSESENDLKKILFWLEENFGLK